MNHPLPASFASGALRRKFAVVLWAVVVVTALSLLCLRVLDKVALFQYLERECLRNAQAVKEFMLTVDQGGRDAQRVRRADVLHHLKASKHIIEQRDIELYPIEVTAFKALGFREVMEIPEAALVEWTELVRLAEAAGSEDFTPELMRGLKPRFETGYALNLRFGALNREVAVTIRNVVLGTLLLNFLILAFPLYLLRRSVIQPMQLAVATADRIAAGDLGADIAFRSDDEVGDLFDSLRAMNASLRQLVVRVRMAAERVMRQSGELVEGNQVFAQRITEQSATLEELASVIEEFTASVKRTAAHSQEVATAATAADEVASRGAGAVRELVAAIAAISANAQRTSEIINVIDGLAFQTNLLALNAAVEAARAGDHGRGFAVVAQEVRALAQRCAASSREIRELLAQSVGRVDEGVQLASEVGTRIADVLAANGHVKKLVSEIAAAMGEQAVGIDEVHRGIHHMDQVTQHNVALMERTAGSSAALNLEAADLDEAVQAFRLGDELPRSPGVAVATQGLLVGERAPIAGAGRRPAIT